MSVRVYTIGHSTRPIGAFVDLLRAEGVDLLADVRRFPRSRRHPHFNIEVLPADLGSAGIGYRHFESLGGRRKHSLTDDASPNTGWEAAGFRSYADYAMTAPFRDALAALVEPGANSGAGDHVRGGDVVAVSPPYHQRLSAGCRHRRRPHPRGP